MLRAYIDDTAFEGATPLLILAGYVSTAEKWAAFSEEWHAMLRTSPAINYFKLREAMKGNGPFHGRFSLADQRQRVAMARDIVERHVEAEFAIAFRVDWYREVFAGLGRPLNNPFYYASTNLISEIVLGMEDNLQLEKQPIELIFDTRVIEQGAIVDGWEKAAATLPHMITSDFSLMPSAPTFQDDKDVLPLQAADMHATLVRLHLTEDLELSEIPGYNRRLRGVLLVPDRNEMRSWLFDLLSWHRKNESS